MADRDIHRHEIQDMIRPQTSSSLSAIWPKLLQVASLMGLLTGAPHTAIAQSQANAVERNVFQMPRFAEQQERHTIAVLRLVRARKLADAEQKLQDLIAKFPDWPMHHYVLAIVQARQNRTSETLDALERAIRGGFANQLAIVNNPAFNALKGLPRYQSLLEDMRQSSGSPLQAAKLPEPNKVEDNTAPVDETNTAWLAASRTLVSAFSFAAEPAGVRVRGGDDAISSRLNLLAGKGQAAGNHGDIYDNRDNGHSRLPRNKYPQLSNTQYSDAAVANRIHYGVNAHQLFNAITIGNSSTAITGGDQWRSQARLIQTNPRLMARAFQHYANDHIYVFPEHADHDPGKGDLFPANTPYMLVSQGSSGSDRPVLDALAAILAAFDPSVKRFLRTKHLVMPTVQMIFRSSLTSLQTDDDYLTGKAHPPVFDGKNLDVGEMIQRANTLQQNEVPPRVDLKVLEESSPVPGISYFGPGGRDEVLFTTPSAIARVVRGTGREKRMVIDASATTDPNGHPLTFEWKVLQGDPDLISIKELAEDGSKAEIRIKWHERRQVEYGPQLMSSRVDIGVFAHNGFHHSAPAFVSLSYPSRQRRTYDAAGRIQEIAYDPKSLSNVYQDPVLFAARGWRDLYAYTKDGAFIGWDRIWNNRIENYTRDGARVTRKDDLGRAVEAQKVVYRIKPGVREMVAVPTGDKLVYRYRNRNDRIGTWSLVTSE